MGQTMKHPENKHTSDASHGKQNHYNLSSKPSMRSNSNGIIAEIFLYSP